MEIVEDENPTQQLTGPEDQDPEQQLTGPNNNAQISEGQENVD